jgi:UDP-N-acetylmuramate: L-alanyl-gamma-D-glutamyl-meso-diaminopimelate ligase
MQLKPGAHIHLMGICGTAMASLAGILKERGFHITGSDTQAYPPMSTQLASLGIEIKLGYKAENLCPKPDLVIVGNVIVRTYAEAVALLASDIPYMSLPKALAEFVIADRQSIVVAGTHGKTTTTSLMAWLAHSCSLGAGFLVGGIPKNFGKSFAVPSGDYFVIEGDEYDTAFFDKVPKFIHYKPKHVILTSVEFDHADIYRDLEHVKEAFVRLMELIPADGTLIACAEADNVEAVVKKCKAQRIFTYGLQKGDYQLRQSSNGFDVVFRGKSIGVYNSRIFGTYNQQNILSTLAMAHQLQWNLKTCFAAVNDFVGVKRRQEIIGEPNGVLIIEDFAHHPTAVRETIAAIQEHFSGRRVFSVFEPRSATSRRSIFQKDYVEAFSIAHDVTLARPYDQSNIVMAERFSTEQLCAELNGRNVPARSFARTDEIIAHLADNCKPGDVVLIMSNGGFDGIYQKLIEALGS